MFKLIQGDCVKVLATLPAASVDAVITDPPYGLEFMGKEWDSFKAGKVEATCNSAGGKEDAEGKGNAFSRSRVHLGAGTPFQSWCSSWGRECLRVLKPGGFLLAFGGTRTHHRLTCGLEDAGFIVRDELMWGYASGFPKAQALDKLIDKKLGAEGNGKEWVGWKTPALKPAWEPVVLCQKPCEGSITENVLKHGVGGFNIDACRIPFGEDEDSRVGTDFVSNNGDASNNTNDNQVPNLKYVQLFKEGGRFPSNLLLTDSILANGVEGVVLANSKPAKGHSPNIKTTGYGLFGGGTSVRTDEKEDYYLPETGSYNKFFLIPKAGRGEKEEGLDDFEEKQWRGTGSDANKLAILDKIQNSKRPNAKNVHPTVKPLRLMEHLIKLVTREGAVVLDPFLGSGTTLLACRALNRSCIGIEQSKEYCEIVKARFGNSTLGEPLELSEN